MKKLAIAAVIMGISMSLAGCGNSVTPNNENTVSSEITIEEAKEIALKHSNLTSDQVKFGRCEIDFDDGTKRYDIEFYHENKEYDYEINASNGQIIQYDYDAEYNNIQQETADNSQVKISEEEAKEIALKHANLTSDQVTFGKIEMDFDDGTQKYDIEFYNNNKEYSYEIDANTGSILSYEKE